MCNIGKIIEAGTEAPACQMQGDFQGDFASSWLLKLKAGQKDRKGTKHWNVFSIVELPSSHTGLPLIFGHFADVFTVE